MPDTVFIDYPGITFLMEGPEMSRELERVAAAIVAQAKESVSVPRGGATSSPGPFPFRRSGDLMNSITHTEARRLEPGIQSVLVYADAQATHRGYRYDQLLREGGSNGGVGYGPYIFVDLDMVHVG